MVGERGWLLRSSRLHEVSTLAESLSFQVYRPLQEFGRDFGRLKMVYEVRQSLGEELVCDCHASLDQRMSETQHEITISFPQFP